VEGRGKIVDVDAGAYLLNVAFAKANCPASADGCVLASAVAVSQFTAQ
jgi:hypothetical protein